MRVRSFFWRRNFLIVKEKILTEILETPSGEALSKNTGTGKAGASGRDVRKSSGRLEIGRSPFGRGWPEKLVGYNDDGNEESAVFKACERNEEDEVVRGIFETDLMRRFPCATMNG